MPDFALVEGIEVDGHDQRLDAFSGYRYLVFQGVPAEGVELVFRIRGAEAVSVLLGDESIGLPAQGLRLVEARAPLAFARGMNDVTRVLVRHSLPPANG